MKQPKKPRKCAARDCSETFVPEVRTQRFHSPTCKNKEAQRRFRERQKAATA
jgi:CGNR zinc finger